ncbi:MAG TPA: response regulator transcription factor [Steroidobacteraceae bacterium]|nr:response regulator transcription factor [Steroidobacteraceae bacterium]
MRLLLIEDHRGMREMIADHLQERGFAVDAFGRGDEALAAAAVTRFDAVVLDLGLPDMDGLDVLASLRRSAPELPAIILTARDSVDHRLLGLNAGADDYIIKPFHLLELEARLRAVLRRPGRRRDAVYTRGGVSFDSLSREATVDGSPLPLTRREATLLEELLRAPGQVIAKDILEERLYALEDAGSANALEAAMSRLRRKLAGARAALRIETQWGIGYRLIECAARPADEAAGSGESLGTR